MTIRTVAHYRADTRRTLKGRSPEWVKLYIGRLIVRVLTADEELVKQGQDHILAPSMARALAFLQDMAVGEDDG